MFDEIPKESFDEKERQILDFWAKEQIFERSVEKRKGSPHFVFYDGPPFATGLPHYGHFLAGTIKDVVLRYKTMKGFHVPRRFGWDCHGLPVEYEVEKAHELSGAGAIEAFGIANFNEECRKIVLRYTEEWKAYVIRMGRWVDFNNTYRTMDLSFMESVWWIFKQLYDQKLVYKGYRVMPFSAKLGTPLSNFEAGENYKEVDDPSLTVAFPLLKEPSTKILAWTTTPWTLVSNLALMVNPEVDYVKVQDKKDGSCYILAKARLFAYYKEAGEYTLIDTFKGKALEGQYYQPLFNYFANRAADGAFRIILENAINFEEGTGVVHSAPAFGELDFFAAQREGIALVCPVDNNGRFTAEIPEYQGQFVKDADKDIIRRVKTMQRMVQQGTIRHRYPFCWRSDTPLIYKVVSTWFVRVEEIKERLAALNQQIHWTPGHLKDGRFGKWLEGARDWNIGRNRYWGTPIPLWESEDGDLIALGSVRELEELTGMKINDLHRHFIDQLTFVKEGKVYRRVPQVFDCWFESGSMPYAQNHYPFENKELFEKIFPADFIAEGLDQTRGWFYTLIVLAGALFDQPAFKNVVVNGIVLAADGAKMSKRLRNYPDPMEVVKINGADAIRLYMMHSPAVKADDLRFQEKGVELVLRQILIPLWNAYTFFLTYVRIYNWRPQDTVQQPDVMIDRWMISMLHKLIREVEQGMDDYDLSRAVEPFVGFVDQLTNWYIRRSRRRFWSDADTPDRRSAFATLYQVLSTLVRIAAPFIPFLTEAIWRNLRGADQPESVHLCDFPLYDEEKRDLNLEGAMEAVQLAVSLGHGLRKQYKLKVRQPLSAAHIAVMDPKVLTFLSENSHLIAEELNVKGVEFVDDETRFVHMKAKPNFPVLGKKAGKQLPALQKAVAAFTQQEIEQILQGGGITLEGLKLTAEDILIEREVHEGRIAANKGAITIALDTALNEELIQEGLARELVNKLNTMRRDADFDVSDRIKVTIQSTPAVQACFTHWHSFICDEVLAVDVVFGLCQGTEWDLNGEPAVIAVERLSY